ncbi:lipoprotein [Streptomyces sp. AcH 505]|nr:lipoprotein [Streptomyces sp. AcH 505]
MRRLSAVVGRHAGALLIITVSVSIGFVLGVTSASTPT